MSVVNSNITATPANEQESTMTTTTTTAAIIKENKMSNLSSMIAVLTAALAVEQEKIAAFEPQISELKGKIAVPTAKASETLGKIEELKASPDYLIWESKSQELKRLPKTSTPSDEYKLLETEVGQLESGFKTKLSILEKAVAPLMGEIRPLQQKLDQLFSQVAKLKADAKVIECQIEAKQITLDEEIAFAKRKLEVATAAKSRSGSCLRKARERNKGKADGRAERKANSFIWFLGQFGKTKRLRKARQEFQNWRKNNPKERFEFVRASSVTASERKVGTILTPVVATPKVIFPAAPELPMLDVRRGAQQLDDACQRILDRVKNANVCYASVIGQPDSFTESDGGTISLTPSPINQTETSEKASSMEDKMNLVQLRKKAKELGIKNWYSLKKAELLTAIKELQAEAVRNMPQPAPEPELPAIPQEAIEVTPDTARKVVSAKGSKLLTRPVYEPKQLAKNISEAIDEFGRRYGASPELLDKAKELAARYDAKKFLNAGKEYVNQAMDSVRSAAASVYGLTLQAYPTSEKAATINGKHMPLSKLALVPTHNWQHGASFLWSQWELYNAIKGQTVEPLKYDDFLFVEMKKDSRGREVSTPEITSALSSLGYCAVTPGFWVKRSHPYADWVRQVFVDNNTVRGRASSMANSPYKYPLAYNKTNGGLETIPVFVGDLKAFGHKKLDGSNVLSRNLRCQWDGALAQLRLHSKPGANIGGVSVGWQGKGLLRRHEVWVVKDAGGNYTLTFDANTEGAIRAIVLHYDNVKGRSSKAIEKLVAGTTTLINLNAYGTGDEKEWCFGGIIVEDYEGTSTTSWQNSNLYSPEVLKLHNDFLLSLVEKMFKRLSSIQNIEHLTMVGSNDQLKTLIAAQQGVNQGAVDAMVFGLNQKWPTHYCEQTNLPAGWAVVGNEVGRDKAKGEKVDELTVTGQPQIYHQCIVTVKAMQWRDVRQVAKFIDAIINSGNLDTLVSCVDAALDITEEVFVSERMIVRGEGLNQRQAEFLAAWIKHVKKDEKIETQASIHEVKAMVSWICGSFVGGAETLIWMSAEDQATMQRDSDGDRLLVTASKPMLAMAKAHIEAIKDLPKPYFEVAKGGDSDGKGTDLEHVAKAEWCSPNATQAQIAIANNYLCAPNKGQGPVGLLVNAAAGLLIHIVWKDVEGQWAPDANTRKWALKLYGFICLLVQNAIDRQKKVHKVPTLKSWRSLDLYSGEVADYDSLPPGEERYYFPYGEAGAMSVICLTARELPTLGNLGGYANMMNSRIIKYWVTFGINLVNSQSPLLDDPNLDETALSQQIADVIVAAGNSDGKSTPWAELKRILNSPLSEADLEKCWIFPEELYAFKKQASLHHKITVASPGVKYFSSLVVDKFTEWRKKREVSAYGRAQLYVALGAHLAKEQSKKPLAGLRSGILRDPTGAVSALSRLMDMQVKQDLSKMNQSEIMQSRKGDDPREVLSTMRGALRNNEVYNPFLRELDKVLNGALKKDLVESVQGLANATMVMWHDAWLSYMAKHDPEETLAALVMLGHIDSNTDLSAGLSKEYEDDAPMELADLAKTLVSKPTWTKEKWADFCSAVHNGERYDGAFWNKLEGDNPLDNVLGEWLPAILLATENADRKVEQNNFVHNTKGFIEAMQTVASREMNVNEFMSHANHLLQSFVGELAKAANSATLATIPEQFKALWIVFQAVVDKGNAASYTSCLLGFAAKAGLVLPGYKVAELFGPLVGAYRVGTWVRKTVELQAVNGTTQDEKLANRLKMIQEALFTTSTRFDREAGESHTVMTLNPRPLVTVPWHIRFGFTSALLDHGYSHYMLAANQKLSTWTETVNGVSKEKLVVGQADRWIYMDAIMHQAKSLIPRYFEAMAAGLNWGVWYGDIMSPGHTSFMIEQFTRLANDSKVAADPVRLANIKERLMALEFQWQLIQDGYYCLLSGEDDGSVKAKLYGQIAAPMWFGGNDKTINTQFSGCRSSAYRPLWRFLLSVLGDVEFGISAAIFDALAGTQTANASRGQDAGEVASGGAVLAGLEGGNNSGATASVRPAYYRDPDQTPGCGFHGQEWVKIPKSPMQEPLGSVVGIRSVGNSFSFTHDLANRKGFKVNPDGSQVVLDNAGILDLRDEVIFAWRNAGLMTEGAPFAKINGMYTPNAVARRIANLKFAEVTNLAQTQTEQSFTNAQAEGVIGCWGATSVFDSFVLSKLGDEESLARFVNKASVYWREFGQLLTTKTKLTYRAANPTLVYEALFAYNQAKVELNKQKEAEAAAAQESGSALDQINAFLKGLGE